MALFLILNSICENSLRNMINYFPAEPLAMPDVPDRKTYNRDYVRSLFDSIAHRYDFLNHFMSLGIDIIWRK
ncbi:MAG TPA: class I SAM-dependent methyltransferase, partial [Candidatus Hypogeohydataceae bacterium YC40]